MFPIIDELMAQVGCVRWPSRWRDIYDGVMADYDKNGGTRLCDPDFYRDIHARYGAYPKHLDVICRAALEIGKRDGLSRLLALLGSAMTDREHAWEDVASFTAPVFENGARDFATDMLTCLATVSMAPYAYEKMAERNIPREIILGTVTMLEAGIDEFRKRHGGDYGYHLMNWNQRAIDGLLFRLGRLEIELSRFEFGFAVFQDGRGNTVTLAGGDTFHRSGAALGSYRSEDADGAFTTELTENEDAFTGYPYDALGRCVRERATLDKRAWKKRLSHGDKVIALHIPSGGALTPDEVDRSILLAKNFVKEFFPEFDYHCFICESWLLDPQLEELLGGESNIVKFGRRFTPISIESGGKSPFYFVFMRPHEETVDYASLSEGTRLERALKGRYLSGGAVYDTFGYFF